MSDPRPYRERFAGAALVTGASSGIGREFSKALAAKGMDVILVARREAELVELAEELRARHSVRASVIVADLLENDAVDNIADQVEQKSLHVGLLVNNAGIGQYGPFETLDRQQALDSIDLNCRVPVALTYAFLPQMLKRGRGGLIYVASIASFQPTPYYATYGASKAFDLMFAEALSAELAPKEIEVLALCPGYTPTGFQAVAGSHAAPKRKQASTSEEVVAAALSSLGEKISVVPGLKNKAVAWSVRLFPRRMITRLAQYYSDPDRA
jgi:uncharacterized protein